MAFNLADVLGTVSKSDPGQEQIVYIALDKLDPDPENFYNLDGLNDLAANIELIGLQQPLRVRPGSDGHYVVVSGHRRRAACLLIRDGDGDRRDMFSDGVPCIIDSDTCSDAMRKLRLIYANSSTRVLSPAEQSRQAEDVTALLYQLKEEGIEFPGRMRDHVAEACKISRSKLARLNAIRKHLVPALLARFDRGEIPEETAYQLSRLPKQAQAGVETCLMTGRKKQLPYSAQIERVVRDLEVYTKPASCRSHAGGPDCTITNVHICRSLWEPYRDCKQLTPNTNDKGICCRDCNDSEHCSWACQECKDRRKLDAAAEKEKAEARAKEEAYRKEIQQKQYRRQ
nr:ParB N-terminal domain-containing protein [Oscillospiraceae bacterium]